MATTNRSPKKKYVVTDDGEKIPVGSKARILGQRSIGLVKVIGYTGLSNYVKVRDHDNNVLVVPDGLITMKGA